MARIRRPGWSRRRRTLWHDDWGRRRVTVTVAGRSSKPLLPAQDAYLQVQRYTNGAYPTSQLTEVNGALYGVTPGGGAQCDAPSGADTGTIFELTTTGTGKMVIVSRAKRTRVTPPSPPRRWFIQRRNFTARRRPVGVTTKELRSRSASKRPRPSVGLRTRSVLVHTDSPQKMRRIYRFWQSFRRACEAASRQALKRSLAAVQHGADRVAA